MAIDLKYKQISEDLYIVHKPVGPTSHDIVNQFRKIFNTRKVGHSGALDPFASGLMIIGVESGTKKLNLIENAEKAYDFTIMLGVKSYSGDNQEDIVAIDQTYDYSDDIINQTFMDFPRNYNQEVPLLSSVKVDGDKLREIFRKFKFIEFNAKHDFTEIERNAIFQKGDNSIFQVRVPKKNIKLHDLKINQIYKESYDPEKYQYSQIFKDSYDSHLLNMELNLSKNFKYTFISCHAHVSKGTYIRQLCEDISSNLGTFGCLVQLERTHIFL